MGFGLGEVSSAAAPAASSLPVLVVALEVSTPVLKWLLLQKESQCEPR